jgi:hypothetical protein
MGALLPLAALMLMLGKKNASIPGASDVTSPQITQSLAQSLRTAESKKGRKSTLLTGGLFGNPSLLSQGLGGL